MRRIENDVHMWDVQSRQKQLAAVVRARHALQLQVVASTGALSQLSRRSLPTSTSVSNNHGPTAFTRKNDAERNPKPNSSGDRRLTRNLGDPCETS